MIHTDTPKQSGFAEHILAAMKGRTIHAFHTEGAGGDHAPDIIKICGEEHVLPLSTNPTRPFTVKTLEDHLDNSIPEDMAIAESRIRRGTIAAEDILHDMGAFSIIAPNSQTMGRVGEVLIRTWQTADKTKKPRGHLTKKIDRNDNFRMRRDIAKYSINPAIAHGIAHEIGSIAAGMRLIPMGQTEGQRVIKSLTPLCLEISATALDGSLEDLSTTNFTCDLAAMNHETQYSRIFRT